MGKKKIATKSRIFSGYSRRASGRRRRRKPPRPAPAPLTIKMILAWAEAHLARTGQWPTTRSGRVHEDPFQTWGAVNQALSVGYRGLPGGSSLARLLEDRRGVQNPAARPRFTLRQILAWADAHHRRTGRWPTYGSGPVCGVPAETWNVIDHALRQGYRGLPGGSSLAQLLADRRGARNQVSLPRLTVRQIMAWADLHHRETGGWPQELSGPVLGSSGETWQGISEALRRGGRGLRGRSSLAKLLAKYRGVRNKRGLPPLTVAQILAWADAHYARTGQWPNVNSGPVAEAPGETWRCLNTLLHTGGRRCIPGGQSLSTILEKHRGVPKRARLPRLTVSQIRGWARQHRRRTGSWPSLRSGEIPGLPGVTWQTVDMALRRGNNGLPGGSSLYGVLRGLHVEKQSR